VRSTRQRTLLTELVSAQQHAFTAEELWTAARESGTPVGLATVYRTLTLLEAGGRVRRLDRGRFIACVPGHHHHLVCVSCGAVEETELCAAPPVTEVRKRHGFVVHHHEADLYGVCGKCA
jgi:Fur family transcriptional regulator, ferric uptake regulator